MNGGAGRRNPMAKKNGCCCSLELAAMEALSAKICMALSASFVSMSGSRFSCDSETRRKWNGLSVSQLVWPAYLDR